MPFPPLLNAPGRLPGLPLSENRVRPSGEKAIQRIESGRRSKSAQGFQVIEPFPRSQVPEPDHPGSSAEAAATASQEPSIGRHDEAAE